MTRGRVYVISNALDDTTRNERGISTDSPAASRKVFQMCAALRLAGVRSCVLSLGRGHADGRWLRHRRVVRRVQGVPVVYAPFWQLKVWSELVSLFATAASLLRLARHRLGPQVVIFYNAEPAYLPTLAVASWLGLRRVLDLEDGRTRRDLRTLRGWAIEGTLRLYDWLCNAGALLACSALADATRLRPTLCYYGLAEALAADTRWQAARISAVLGGTLDASTGADLLVETIRQLRATRPAWAAGLRIVITGKGPALPALQALASEHEHPALFVHGRTSDVEYRAILGAVEVGLALKPRSGPLAHTTFPSKVVELASAGLLVLTTDISDVRAVLGDGALYLLREDATELGERLRWIVEHRESAQALAETGCQGVQNRCAPTAAGRSLADFLLREPA